VNLVTTTQSLEIDLGAAVAASEMQVSAEWIDHTTTSDTPGHTDSASNGTTAATIVAAPASSTYRIVKHLSIYNKDTAPAVVTVQFNNNSTLRELIVAHLVPGNSITWSPEAGWQLVNTNTATDTSTGVVTIATPAQVESASSLTAAVTPGRTIASYGIAKAWIKAAGAGTSVNASFNATTITDIGTGRLGVNLASGLSSRDSAIIVSAIRGVTTYAVADVEDNNMRVTAVSAGHVEIESYDHTATTMAADDPASYFMAMHGDIVPAAYA
jgi:hypothetical protein